MPFTNRSFTAINDLLIHQKYKEALQLLEKASPGNTLFSSFYTEINRIRNYRLTGTKTTEEITAYENSLSGKIREFMEEMEGTDIKKIMIFFNNAPNAIDISLSKEAGAIDDVFSNKPGYYLMQKNHKFYDDIIALIDTEKPYGVQFSMHADSVLGLKMTDETGNKKYVDKDRFKKDMQYLSKTTSIELLFLNGCQTLPLAEEVKEFFPNVIATNSDISDKAALILSSSFYTSLINRNAIGDCFSYAINALRNNDDEDVKAFSMVPQLLKQ